MTLLAMHNSNIRGYRALSKAKSDVDGAFICFE